MQGARTCLLASRSLGMRRTYQYVAMTKDEAQSRHGGTDGLFTKPSIVDVIDH